MYTGRSGGHVELLKWETRVYSIRLFAVAALSGPAQAICKVSLLSLLLRILVAQRTAPWQHRNLRILVWGLIGVVTLGALGTVAAATWGCTPLDGLGWRPRDQCAIGTNVAAILLGTLFCILNFAMCIVAWRLVVGENTGAWMKRKKQILVLAIGVSPCVCVRLK